MLCRVRLGAPHNQEAGVRRRPEVRHNRSHQTREERDSSRCLTPLKMLPLHQRTEFRRRTGVCRKTGFRPANHGCPLSPLTSPTSGQRKRTEGRHNRHRMKEWTEPSHLTRELLRDRHRSSQLTALPALEYCPPSRRPPLQWGDRRSRSLTTVRAPSSQKKVPARRQPVEGRLPGRMTIWLEISPLPAPRTRADLRKRCYFLMRDQRLAGLSSLHRVPPG
jgi:hypothetical protein